MCRMSKSGLRDEKSWSPMKLAQVIGSVAPEVEQKINELSLESIFNPAGAENGMQDENLSARRALMEYATSLLDDNGSTLGAAELGELDALISERSGEFQTVEQRFAGFKAVEEYLTGRFGEIEMDGYEEHDRRQMALASVGMSYLDDELPSEVEENGEVDSEERALILDSEFIAIYW